MSEVQQSAFEGWAIVEMMGHRKEIGHVTTEAFGPVVLFRVDTPELPEREEVLRRSEYCGGEHLPVGAKVRRQRVAGRSCLVAPGSLYALNPCTEEAALAAIEASTTRPLMLLELPEGLKAQAKITSGDPDDEDDFEADPDDEDDF